MAKQKSTASKPDMGVAPIPQEKKDKEGEDRTGEELLQSLRAFLKKLLMFAAPHQSVKIVSLVVSGGATTWAKDVGGDVVTTIDLTPGPLTVSGTCVNLVGDVQGLILGLDQNITIEQVGLTMYTGAASRRWSLVFPQYPPGVPGGQYAVVLQCCFSPGTPLDSLSFNLIVPPVPAPGPGARPAAGS
jgi:hypothetical protein